MKGRRNFLKKIASAASAAALGIFNGVLAKNKTNMQIPAVTNIKPLGFQWETRDPFLFCVHHEDFFPKGNENMGPDPDQLQGRQIGQDFLIKDGWRMYHGQTVPGFPSHPHRGFETITVVRTGIVDHSDSLGAAGRYGHGDVQWMTAGKGIQHAEMFPLIHQDGDNPLELFQIWLNLPKKNKFIEPHFKMLWSDTIPIYTHLDDKKKETKIEIIAGSIQQYNAPFPPPNSWAAEDDHEVAIWNIKMESGAKWILPVAKNDINRTLYFYKGDQILVDGEVIPNYHSVEVSVETEILIESGDEDAQILLLQGKPINEPVVQHGPFVMNSREEIQQAFADYQQTEFGGWPWDRNDPVHPKEKGRFALHADGTSELPI